MNKRLFNLLEAKDDESTEIKPEGIDEETSTEPTDPNADDSTDTDKLNISKEELAAPEETQTDYDKELNKPTPAKKNILINNEYISVSTDFKGNYFANLSCWIPSFPMMFNDVIKLIRTLQEDEVFYLNIGNVGGSVNSGFRLIKALRECKAKIVTEVAAIACSMGAMIWSCGDILKFEYGILMYHTISTDVWGKTQLVKDSGMMYDDYAKQFLGQILKKGLISEEEYNNCIINSNDLFFKPSEEFTARIEKYNSVDRHAQRIAKLNGTSEEH